ncbi:MAG: methyltransferase domain-containing protein [Acetobacteraceae bacterium]|nr:methyltransferase domain-containing protein [Acetobacteraceae bacterium]
MDIVPDGLQQRNLRPQPDRRIGRRRWGPAAQKVGRQAWRRVWAPQRATGSRGFQIKADTGIASVRNGIRGIGMRASDYDEAYYLSHCGPIPYTRERPEWGEFFGKVADEIARLLRPRTMFDAGCAHGFLVEAAWRRGIRTWGRDISEFAVSQVRRDLRDYVTAGSITESLGGPYDLVTCIEVLEHMPEEESLRAIAAMASAAPRILFSSSPIDFDEPTHINVKPPRWWLERFAEAGFAPVPEVDARFLTPHAFVVERVAEPVSDRLVASFACVIEERLARVADERAAAKVRADFSDTIRKLHDVSAEAETARIARSLAEAKLADAVASAAAGLAGVRSEAAAGLEAARAETVALREAVLGQQARAVRAEAELATVQASLAFHLGLRLLRVASVVPRPVRRAVRSLARPAWRALGGRLTSRAEPAPAAAAAPEAPAASAPPALEFEKPLRSAEDLVGERFSALRGFTAFPLAEGPRRLSVLTDSVGPSSLFGGVGTSLLLAARLADRLGAQLRIVTRTEPPDAEPVREVLKRNHVQFDGVLETAFLPLDGSRDLPLGQRELFLTTSWWSTWAALRSVPRERVIALVQEDERMFYPRGDDRLRCAETLAEPGIPVIVNTEALFRHLRAGPEPLLNLDRDGDWFEPAFPGVAPVPQPSGKRRLFFYARPHNLRNLFWRGIEALDAAAADGIFAPDEWEIHWAGNDVPPATLSRGVVPIRHASMAWGDYQRFIASMDAGFVLMDTPHPSYPPLDLAAAGAAVLTNTHPGKESLAHYSDNIMCVPLDLGSLREGLRRLEVLARDDAARARNRELDHIQRDWTQALDPVVGRLASRFQGI